MNSLAVDYLQSLKRVWQQSDAVWTPPPNLTLSEWAERELRLSPEDSAAPGRYIAANAEYQRGIMDTVTDPGISEVVIMSSAQVGKTLLMKVIIGYYVDQDPSPMLMIQPTVEMANTFSKDRLAPMIRDTPALRGKISDPKSRSSGNTVLHKRFPGGHITMAGANSPASLASRPVRIVMCDEVDRYPESAGSEGDPVNLARKRATTFWNRKIILTSTPTLKGLSRIEMAYEASDQRRYYVPCPHCGTHQVLKWRNVLWDDGKPETAAIVCEDCGARWSESDRLSAVRHGEWRAESTSNGIAGFHLSELYSPWSTPAKMAEAFLAAKHGGTELLKTWVNTALGETWVDEGEGIDDIPLLSRREDYPDELPIRRITAGVDIQGDRIEASIAGWSEGEECWLLDQLIIPGDTARPDVWQDLRYMLTDAGVQFAAIDSGFRPDPVYEFCTANRWAVPIKGMAGTSRPLVEDERKRRQRLRTRRKRGIAPEPLGVDQGKATIYSRLKLHQPGPGYIHFPNDPAFDEEYFAQLAAEKMVTRYTHGRPRIEWVQTRPRNEALDCLVYALAAFRLAGGIQSSKGQDKRRSRRRVVKKS